MKKEYTISNEKFLEAKSLITENGGTIYPDGRFEIQGVKGKFNYENGILEVWITDKPWLASWGMIEDKLDEFFD